jgi:tetratricopeptide (TPR) repeat protein
MSGVRQAIEDIAARTEALATEGQWAEVYDLLAAEETARILANESMAYRFAEALYFTARFWELAQYAAAYEESSRRWSDMLGVMRATNLAGIAAFELGRMNEAQQRFDALMDLGLAEGHDEMQARAANNLGTLSSLRGDQGAALSHYGRCQRLYETLDHVRGVAQTTYNQGLTYSDLGRYEDAVTQFDCAIALSESIDFTPVVAMARTARAELEVRRGDPELGRRFADRAIEQAEEIGDPVSVAEALRVRALASTHTPAEALDDLARAEEAATETGQALLEARIQRDRGRVLLKARCHEPGRRCLEEAAEQFEELGANGEARDIRGELAELDDHASQGADEDQPPS